MTTTTIGSTDTSSYPAPAAGAAAAGAGPKSGKQGIGDAGRPVSDVGPVAEVAFLGAED